MSLVPTTATELYASGCRTIAAWNWRNGSYLKLSDTLPLTYHCYGNDAPMVDDRVAGVRPYNKYFGKPVWVAVRVEE
jgi:hypothetical protein